MGKWLFLLFLVVPFVELYLLLAIGRVLGFAGTLALVIATGLLGAFLAKLEGLRVLRRWQGALREGRVPEDGVLNGALVLLGGVLLVTPGVLTDLIGLSLLIPTFRRVVARFVRRRFERQLTMRTVRAEDLYGFARAGFDPGNDRIGRAPRGQVTRREHPSEDVIDVEGYVVESSGKESRSIH